MFPEQTKAFVNRPFRDAGLAVGNWTPFRSAAATIAAAWQWLASRRPGGRKPDPRDEMRRLYESTPAVLERDCKGRPLRTLTALQDVTERKTEPVPAQLHRAHPQSAPLARASDAFPLASTWWANITSRSVLRRLPGYYDLC